MAHAAAEVPVSVHEWSRDASIVSVLWVVIGMLGAALVWYALGDRSGIKGTLDRLVTVVEELRLDLAENYAKKIDLEHLSQKLDRHIEHGIVRREQERRIIEDGSG